jgi:hypothetical protein
MPLDASAERCNIFDIAEHLARHNHAVGSRQGMVREALVAEALHGSRLAHDALCYAAMRVLAIGDPLPNWLGRYVVLIAAEGKPTAKRGRRPKTKALRDTAIASVAHKISKNYGLYGLKPTRNIASEAESACSIVTEALKRHGIKLKEASVNAIWQRMESSLDEAQDARIEATMAMSFMRSAFAPVPRSLGDTEWLEKNDPRERARSWRERETRCLKGRSRRKRIRPSN